ncbi:MAG TPA: (Fe-S)-binding protein [Bacteroidales bacterium]|nr:(Fe-S)-binding protein [Bacteroidales bacterium]
MGFDLFVIPFTAGLAFLLVWFLYKTVEWLSHLNRVDRTMLRRGVISSKTVRSVKEVILESLLHRKIFRTNPLLGYMHMSLAFGWFLLIVAGNVEAMIFKPATIHPPYYPIFFRFFEPEAAGFPGAKAFEFIMDFLLVFILSGVALALFKRIRSRALGMKKTTRLLWYDRLALYSLWCIFPFRLLAESITSGIYQTGGIVTGSLGNILAGLIPLQSFEYPAWWAYSLALGLFFVALPFSRYMHIPTEVVLIFLRNYGIHTRNSYSSYSEIEVYSCSRCGICIDPCPMSEAAGIQNIQSVYMIRNIRYKTPDEEVNDNCLMCGRCNIACPVGIVTTDLRAIARNERHLSGNLHLTIPATSSPHHDVIYFAGCMGQLTPAVTQSMETILQQAGEDYLFLDKEESICCGRPLALAGRIAEAKQLMEINRDKILSSGARTLVTSCPICYKVFREDYHLPINVMHHTQYLHRLLMQGRIRLRSQNISLAYHDPCELGRGSGIYEEPRQILRLAGNLLPTASEKEKSICCGGSLGNTVLNQKKRHAITEYSLESLTINNPDTIVTSCPLCKKTFAQRSDRPVLDIAEVVKSAIFRDKDNIRIRENYQIPAEEFSS